MHYQVEVVSGYGETAGTCGSTHVQPSWKASTNTWSGLQFEDKLHSLLLV